MASITRTFKDGNFFSAKKKWLETEEPEFKEKLYHISRIYDETKIIYTAIVKLGKRRQQMKNLAGDLNNKRLKLLQELSVEPEKMVPSEFTKFYDTSEKYHAEVQERSKTLCLKVRGFQYKIDSYRDTRKSMGIPTSPVVKSFSAPQIPNFQNSIPSGTPMAASQNTSEMSPLNSPVLVALRKDLMSEYEVVVTFTRDFMDFCTIFVTDSLQESGILEWAKNMVDDIRKEDFNRNTDTFEPLFGVSMQQIIGGRNEQRIKKNETWFNSKK